MLPGIGNRLSVPLLWIFLVRGIPEAAHRARNVCIKGLTTEASENTTLSVKQGGRRAVGWNQITTSDLTNDGNSGRSMKFIETFLLIQTRAPPYLLGRTSPRGATVIRNIRLEQLGSSLKHCIPFTNLLTGFPSDEPMPANPGFFHTAFPALSIPSAQTGIQTSCKCNPLPPSPIFRCRTLNIILQANNTSQTSTSL